MISKNDLALDQGPGLSMWITNWHLPRALPMTEQQRHLPSASMETDPHAGIAVDLQQTLREFKLEWGTLLQGIWWDRSLDSWMFLGTDFIISILASPYIYRSTKSLHGDIRSPWLTKMSKMSISWYWTPPSPKPYILVFSHCCFGADSQSYLRCCLLGLSPHFAPNKP